MKRKSRTLMVLTLALLAVFIAGALGLVLWNRNQGDTLASTRRNGVIRIGYAVEAPYAFLSSTGEVTGESPEIARIIAARLGIRTVEWRLAEFARLLDGLDRGSFDVVAAGMFITPERERRVSFSIPTSRISAGLLVLKGNPLALHSYGDIAGNQRARVAALAGSVEEARLAASGCPDGRILRVPDAASGRAAVRNGLADALALSAPTLRWMSSHPIAGATEMADPFVEAAGSPAPRPALAGFAFRKRDRALAAAWNAELARFIGTAEHRDLVRQFGFTQAEMPESPAPEGAGKKR